MADDLAPGLTDAPRLRQPLGLPREMAAPGVPADDLAPGLADDYTAERAKIAAGVRTATATPDQAARALQLSRQTGLPGDVVGRNLDRVEQEQKIADMWKAAQGNPILMRKLTDPSFLTVAQDDVDSFAAMEGGIGAIRAMRGPAATLTSVTEGIFKSFGQGFEMARQGVRMQAADLFGFEAMGEDARRKFGAAKFDAALTTPEFESSTARGLYGGATSTIRAVPSVAASIFFRNPTIGLGAMGLQTEAEAYGKYRERGASGGMAALGAIGEGAVEVATEMLPMGFLVEKFGKAGAFEFLKGMLLREMPTEQVATFLQDAIDTAVANPDKTWGEFAAERPDAAYQTALAVLVQSSVFGSANVVARRLAGPQAQADAAEAGAQQAEALAQFAAASKVMGRDAETVREFVAQVADEQGDAPTEFYVDAEQIVGVLNQSGMTMQEFEALAPVAAGQMNEPGGLVRLPMSEFVGMGEAAASLIDHIRTSEDMPSRAEAREFFASDEGARLKGEVDRELSALTERDAYQADVEKAAAGFRADLDAAGRFTPEANKFLAALPANYYAATAKRLGITVDEFLDRYQLRSTSKAVKAKPGDVPMSQAAGLPDVEGAARRVAQQERMNADRAEKLPADHPLVATGKRALARLKAELESVSALRAGFDAWFSGSKVVSDSGKPFVVYHGTTHDITTFRRKPNGRALWASSAEVAGTYPGDSPGANVMPVYMAMRNPLIVDVGGASWQELRFEGERLSTDGLADIAEERGYDGLIIRNLRDENTDDGGSEAADHYAVFKPEQIKSAIGNRGTYDPNDPSILNQSAQRDMIELRKREAVLKRLLECL